jgi:hypothetical protein
MIDMDLVVVDTLTAYSIEPGDMIGISGDVVTVVSVDALSVGYLIEYVNDYGEEGSLNVSDDAQFHLYMFE